MHRNSNRRRRPSYSFSLEETFAKRLACSNEQPRLINPSPRGEGWSLPRTRSGGEGSSAQPAWGYAEVSLREKAGACRGPDPGMRVADAFHHATSSQSQRHLKGLFLSPFPFFVPSHFSPLCPLPFLLSPRNPKRNRPPRLPPIHRPESVIQPVAQRLDRVIVRVDRQLRDRPVLPRFVIAVVPELLD